MSNFRPDIIARNKASKHPLKHGRFYTAKVTHVTTAGLITIYIQELQSHFGPLVQLNLTNSNTASVGDFVKCAFADEFFREVIVFGFTQKRDEIYALQADLTAELNIIKERLDALELGKWT